MDTTDLLNRLRRHAGHGTIEPRRPYGDEHVKLFCGGCGDFVEGFEAPDTSELDEVPQEGEEEPQEPEEGEGTPEDDNGAGEGEEEPQEGDGGS